jgi:hypothetical protein
MKKRKKITSLFEVLSKSNSDGSIVMPNGDAAKGTDLSNKDGFCKISNEGKVFLPINFGNMHQSEKTKNKKTKSQKIKRSNKTKRQTFVQMNNIIK